MYGEHWGAFGGGMWFFWIIFLVAIVILIVSLTSSNKNTRNSQPESALDILNKRYARGEINKEEYLRRKSTLDKHE